MTKQKFLNEAKLKDFKKIKSKRIIPLGIMGKDVGLTKPQEMSKLTVVIGLMIQDDLPRFLQEYFDINIFDGEIHLVLTQKGQQAIRVRTKKDPNYLQKTIDTFKKYLKSRII